MRLTASEVMGADALAEILSEFREEHSGITLELVLSYRDDDILRRDAIAPSGTGRRKRLCWRNASGWSGSACSRVGTYWLDAGCQSPSRLSRPSHCRLRL